MTLQNALSTVILIYCVANSMGLELNPLNTMKLLRRYLPILTWGAEYSRRMFTNDLIVAVIVAVMLIPQSLIYRFLEESE